MRKILKAVCRECEIIKSFSRNESGAISVEVVLLIVVLIALVAAFKTGITGILATILAKIGVNAAAI